MVTIFAKSFKNTLNCFPSLQQQALGHMEPVAEGKKLEQKVLPIGLIFF